MNAFMSPEMEQRKNALMGISRPNPLMGEVQSAFSSPNKQAQQPPSPEKLDEYIGHNRTVNDMLAQLLAKPDLTSKDVLTSLTDAMRLGAVLPQQAAAEAAQVPTDPQQIRAFVMQHFLRNVDIARQLRMMRGGGASMLPSQGMPSSPAMPSPGMAPGGGGMLGWSANPLVNRNAT